MGKLAREFIKSCKSKNLEKVRNCLSRGVDVNTILMEDRDGLLGRWSGLTIAAFFNDPELLEILLSHPDIKINKTTRSMYGRQWTGLMFACEYGNSAIVSRLVQVPGLDINYQDEEGVTAALLASMGDYTRCMECVRILAETGRVDWNKRNNWDQTPLYWALVKGHSYTVDIIMQQPNIDYNVKTRGGQTLGHAAVLGGDVKCVETLAAQESFDCWNILDKPRFLPIRMVLGEDQREIVKILLRCPRVNLDVVSRMRPMRVDQAVSYSIKH